MKIKQSDLIMTENVPKGQENDYYTEEQSAVILSKVKTLTRMRIISIIILLLSAGLNIAKGFVEKGGLVSNILGISSLVALASALAILIVFIVKNKQLKKYLKNIT